MKSFNVDSAKVLAAAGLTASIAVTLGGWLDVPALVGTSGAIMLIGNLFVLLNGVFGTRSSSRKVGNERSKSSIVHSPTGGNQHDEGKGRSG